MIRNMGASLLALVLSLQMAPFSARADVTAAGEGRSSGGAGLILKPGADDGRIAFVTAKLLERMHYSHHRFDDSVSSQFLDRYLESLDPPHLTFLQSDLDEFEPYRTNLDRLTVARQDTTPAFVIFSRFVERLKQRVDYVDNLLDHEKFQFNTNERIVIDRHDASYPKDLTEARQLWRDRLRYEYLLEKLGYEDPSKARDRKTTNGKTVEQQIVETLKHRYHRNLRTFTDWNDSDVLGIYLTSLAHVYDPHSDYFNKEQLDNFTMTMNLSLFGIGAQLASEDGYCKIQNLLTGGPAIKSKKIKEGDRIVAVAQGNQPPVDVVDMNINKIVQLIRGPKGTEVRLTIVSGTDLSKRSVVALVRDKIPLEDQAAKGKIIEMPDDKGQRVRLGVIDLPSFYAPMEFSGPKAGEASAGQYTSVDVSKLLTKFKAEHVAGVILDLRRNGGGSLEEAIRLTGLFIKEGPVVQVAGSDGSVVVDEDNDPSVLYDGPLIVLTSRFSASASEIVAGALQDYGRALIVGDCSTHGKGTVQNLNPLKSFMRMDESDTNDPGALKVTIRKFYRASGASTQLKGVMPDIVLPSVLNYIKDLGESSLENPLPWDTIPSAKYDKLNLVQPYLALLLKRSTERVATNQDFAYIREDIEQYRKKQADKSASLNEKEQLREMKDNEARAKARDKERLARKQSDQKIYEITLKQADLPGLPPPKTNNLANADIDASTTITSSGEIDRAALKTNTLTFTVSQRKAGQTNLVQVTGSPSAETSTGTESAEDKAPVVDASLDETERILLDYLLLWGKGESMLATQQSGSSR